MILEVLVARMNSSTRMRFFLVPEALLEVGLRFGTGFLMLSTPLWPLVLPVRMS